MKKENVYTGYGYPQNCPKCKCGVIGLIELGNNKGKLKCYNCGYIYLIRREGNEKNRS